MDLALNDLQGLVCHKTKPNYLSMYISVCATVDDGHDFKKEIFS